MYLESCEFEGAFLLEFAILIQPPFRPEDLSVFAPEVLHPAHGVGDVEHDVALADATTVRQDIVSEALLVILNVPSTTCSTFSFHKGVALQFQ